MGVSEAALYRHFPSKAKMFEGLIAFIEETVFSRITRIMQDFERADDRCEKTLTLVLTFAEKKSRACAGCYPVMHWPVKPNACAIACSSSSTALKLS